MSGIDKFSKGLLKKTEVEEISTSKTKITVILSEQFIPFQQSFCLHYQLMGMLLENT